MKRCSKGRTAADSAFDSAEREDVSREQRPGAPETPRAVGLPAPVSVARGLLDREDLLQMLDRAVTKRVTVISAPPGSGKTSLLRAWADRSTNLRRVAFVSVDRDQQDAQRFWSAVLDAIRSPARSIDPETQPAATAALDGDQLVDTSPVGARRAGRTRRADHRRSPRAEVS